MFMGWKDIKEKVKLPIFGKFQKFFWELGDFR